MDEDFEEVNNNNEISSEDMTTLIDESKSLLKKLYDAESVQSQNKHVNNAEDLRMEVSNFIVSQMESIRKTAILRGVLESEIIKSVLTHNLSNGEMQSMYATISRESSVQMDSLLKLFVPTQQSNTMLKPISTDDDAQSIELTQAQRSSMEKLMRLLENQPKNSEN